MALGNEIANLFVRVSADTRELLSGLDRASKATTKFGQNMRTAGTQVTAGLTLPITAVGGAAVAMATTFEAEMRKVTTLVGISQDQVDTWSKELLDLAPKLGKSPKELAEGLFFITSAGLRGTEAIEALTGAAQASAAGLGETKDVANALTSAMLAYGESGLTAEQATNVLIATVREGKVEASELAGSLGRVIPIASQMGVSFGQVGGFIATFSRLGVDSAESVTALRGVLSTLLKPTKDAREQLAALGLSVEGLRASIRERGLAATLIDLAQATKGNEDALAAVIPNVRALAGVMGVTGAQAEKFREIEQNIVGDTTAVSNAVAGTETTFAHMVQQVKAGAAVLAIEFGNELLPIMKDMKPTLEEIVEAGKNLVKRFADLSPETKKLILAVAGLAAVAGPLLVVLGTLVITVGALVSPVGGVVLALAALGGALVVAYQQSEAFRTIVQKLMPVVKVLAGVFLAQFKVILQVVKTTFAVAANIIAFFLNAFTGDSEAAGKNIEAIYAALADGVIGIVEGMWDGIVFAFKGRADEALAKVKEFKDKVVGFFVDLKDRVVGKSEVPEMVDGVVQEFKRQRDEVVPIMKQTEIQVVGSYEGMRRASKEASAQMTAEMAAAASQIKGSALEMWFGIQTGLIDRVKEGFKGAQDNVGRFTEQTIQQWEFLKKTASALGFEFGKVKEAADGASGRTDGGGGIAGAGSEAKKAADRLKGLIESLKEAAATTGMNQQQVLAYKLELLGATPAQVEQALALQQAALQAQAHADALQEVRDREAEVIKSTKGYTKEVRRLSLDLETGLAAQDRFTQVITTNAEAQRMRVELEQIVPETYADTVAAIDQLAGRYKGLDKVYDDNGKKVGAWAKATTKAARDVAGAFGDKFVKAFEDLRDVFDDVFGGRGSGLLSKVKSFGKELLTMAGPAGVIFNAVDSIGQLFGFDLVDAVKSALGAIGKGIGSFFAGIGRAFGIGGHTKLAAKEFELFGRDLEKTVGGTFTDSFQRADARVKAFSGDMREAITDIVVAWDEGVIELGKGADGLQEDWRAIARAFTNLVAAGASVEEIKRFFFDFVDAAKPLDEQVEQFIQHMGELAKAKPLKEELGELFESLVTEAVEAGRLGVAEAADLSEAFGLAETEQDVKDLMEQIKDILFREPFEGLLAEALDLGAVTGAAAREMLASFGKLETVEELRAALEGLQRLVTAFGDEAEGSAGDTAKAMEDLADTLDGSAASAEGVVEAARGFDAAEVAEFAAAVEAAGQRFETVGTAARDMRAAVVGEAVLMFNALESEFTAGTARIVEIWDDMVGAVGQPIAAFAPSVPTAGFDTPVAAAVEPGILVRVENRVVLPNGRELWSAIEEFATQRVYTESGPLRRIR